MTLEADSEADNLYASIKRLLLDAMTEVATFVSGQWQWAEMHFQGDQYKTNKQQWGAFHQLLTNT